jgi:hypothetical protein
MCTKWGEGNRPRAAHALSKVMTLAEAAGGGLLKHGPTTSGISQAGRKCPAQR